MPAVGRDYGEFADGGRKARCGGDGAGIVGWREDVGLCWMVVVDR